MKILSPSLREAANSYPQVIAWGNSIGLKSDGSVVAWGMNHAITNNSGFVAVAAGSSHGLALKGCRTGDVNCDDVVNVDDLLAVINAWGPAPAHPRFVFPMWPRLPTGTAPSM
jgi:hypothetical protein